MIIQVGCQLLMGHCSPPLVCCEQRQPRAWCNASPLAALLFAECFGVLAVQMPLSWGAPSHRLMRETLANGGPGGLTLSRAELREAVAREWVQGAAVYYDLLSSARTLDIWETEYLQVLAGPDPVLEWVSATGLRPILNGLGDEERKQFLAEYTQRLRVAYPMRNDGRTLYPFRRLFMVAMV